MSSEIVRNRDVTKEMESKEGEGEKENFWRQKRQKSKLNGGVYQKRWWESLELWLLPNTDLVFLLLLPERMRLLTVFARR